MGTTKKIDIIIPAYNAQDTIERTIASILLQSVKDLCRITIINDGGGDTSYDKVINRYKDLIDLREIKISSNMGPGVARQCGIDNTDLEYFTCIDADDTFAGAFALEILMTNLDKNSEYHVCIGSFIEEQENLQFINHKNDLIWMFGADVSTIGAGATGATGTTI
jgi:glycosyltransferase involved in cell wall biosynthesis